MISIIETNDIDFIISCAEYIKKHAKYYFSFTQFFYRRVYDIQNSTSGFDIKEHNIDITEIGSDDFSKNTGKFILK